jgi:hypothetical protein
MLKTSFKKTSALFVGLSLATGMAVAGPVIIDGTDANEHGGVSGGVNQTGWLYMQRALENVGGAVGNGNKIVVDLGTSGSTAGAAINSAFNLSSLVGAGWTKVNIDGFANIASFLAGNTVNGVSLATAGLLYLPTYQNAAGDLDFNEMAAINAGAASIATFVGGAGNPSVGGGLFSQGESGVGAYGWLQTLVTGILPVDVGGGGINTPINLTAAGVAAFPGLPNSAVQQAIPWHGYFGGNLGSLSVLGTALDGNFTRNVIIGGGAGTVITPNPVPEGGSTIALLGAAVLGLVLFRRRTVQA